MSRILIIEDEAALASAIGQLTRRMGFEPLLAASAAQGLEQLRRRRPDLVVLDIGLPDRSGLEVLQEIRSIDADLPVLIITAHGHLQNAVEAKKRGASGYLVKPLDLRELEKSLQVLLQSQGDGAVAAAVPDAPQIPRC
ncbi:response regulator [Verrucomicrobium spinosum]|uniref:response regulator n=1 Tax=Verrucomicrobium spinosum TaxID=2736 RepID=UPI0009461C1A|nr:response regulator [Verrucomicrobium spinosum]